MDPIECVRTYLRQANSRAEISVDRPTVHDPAFLGYSPDGRAVAIEDPDGCPPSSAAPESFRVAAIVPVFNEEDIIAHTLSDLLRQGLDVYVIDNWSTDRTVERTQAFIGRGVRSISRFPAEGPSGSYDLGALMTEVERLAGTVSDADWIVLHDADERRRPPWPGVNLRDALWHVDRHGFNCVDHITLNFWPTDPAGFDPCGPDLEQQLRYFEFSAHPGHFHQRRAWKHLQRPVALAPTGGHDVGFDGRRVYPYKFLLKHYPIRSQTHGERKVLHERVPRWNLKERAMGWHRQYEALDRFVREPRELIEFDSATFYERFVVERLSGVGIFDRPPDWATPPAW